MQKSIITLPEIKLIGITIKTNNALENNKSKAKIGKTIQKYFSEGLSEDIPNRKKPLLTYCAFTEYESDFTGNYTYLIGEEVESFHNLPKGLAKLIIPTQTYIRFKVGPGSMPELCLKSWQKIWQMDTFQLGGKRRYHTDFEIYDYNTYDPQNAIFYIYIGIE